MKYIAFGIIFLLWGCNSEKQFCKFHENEPIKAAQHCDSWYPVTPLTITHDSFINHTELVYSDPIYVNCDSIIIHDTINKTHIVKIPQIRYKLSRDTVVRLTTKVIVDSAKLQEKELENKQISDKLVKEQTWCDRWRWATIILILIFVFSNIKPLIGQFAKL